jgi:hypothetical protein
VRWSLEITCSKLREQCAPLAFEFTDTTPETILPSSGLRTDFAGRGVMCGSFIL